MYAHKDVTLGYVAAKFQVSTTYAHRVMRNELVTDPQYDPRMTRKIFPNIKRKLDDARADKIRSQYLAGMTLRELSEKHGLTTTALNRIVLNETYFDPTYTPPSPEQRRAMRNERISRGQLAHYRKDKSNATDNHNR
jgi:hypothetical protein